jgi:hypothetical protein
MQRHRDGHGDAQRRKRYGFLDEQQQQRRLQLSRNFEFRLYDDHGPLYVREQRRGLGYVDGLNSVMGAQVTAKADDSVSTVGK